MSVHHASHSIQLTTARVHSLFRLLQNFSIIIIISYHLIVILIIDGIGFAGPGRARPEVDRLQRWSRSSWSNKYTNINNGIFSDKYCSNEPWTIFSNWWIISSLYDLSCWNKLHYITKTKFTSVLSFLVWRKRNWRRRRNCDRFEFRVINGFCNATLNRNMSFDHRAAGRLIVVFNC